MPGAGRAAEGDESGASVAAEPATHVDGVAVDALARRLGVPRVAAYAAVGSTMDVAHALARAGAPGGTLVLADAQDGGRGRVGRRWASAPGAGIWMTLVERPTDPAALGVLSLRLGLYAATALDALAGAPVRLKWPNDLFLHDRKLGGVLVEARWRDAQPEWVAIGFGLNLRAPDGVEGAIGLPDGAARVPVLCALVPALRAAAAATGTLDAAELAGWAARDWAAGRRIVAPVAGVVRGLAGDGALLVDTSERAPVRLRQGTLEFAP